MTAEPGPVLVQGVAVEQEWRRLDRRSIWVAPLKPLAGLLATGVVVVTFRGWDQVGVVEPVIGAVVAVGVFVLSIWYWATTHYRVTATHVELSSGMVVRKHRSVARDRLDAVLAVARDAVPGLLAPFLEPDRPTNGNVVG